LLVRSWEVMVLAVLVVPVLSLVANYFYRRITATARLQRAREADLASAAHEMLTAVPVVKTFGRSDYEEQRFAEDSRKAMAAALDSAGLEARFSWIFHFFEALSISAVVWLGMWLVTRGRPSVRTLVVFLILLQNMVKPTRTA